MLFNFIFSAISFTNMNGDVYDISNRDIYSETRFPTLYEQINSSYEYFDVYSHPITSKYADVYWIMMPEVILPSNIINRFSNKIMAVVGYETDMVFLDGSRVPITWSYNHHYLAYLRSDKTNLVKINNVNLNDNGQYNHGYHRLWKVNSSYEMSSLFFSEANGGEFRQSFHGYPTNYAQLIKSPKYFDLQPMQIDTRNRDPKYINQSKFVAGILPKSSSAPKNACYSGLLECPCTTRIHKKINHKFDLTVTENCYNSVLNKTTCLDQSNIFGGKYNGNVSVILNKSLPYGCFYRKNKEGITTNIYLNRLDSRVKCESDTGHYYGNIINDPITNISLEVNITETQTILTLSGNSEYWYGIAFNAHTMADLPYSIIVDGYGNITERKLGNHDGGELLNSSIKVLENYKTGNVRTIRITRKNIGKNTDYYTFSKDKANIPLLLALGNTPTFKYHKVRGTNNLYLNSIEGTTCICDNGKGGSINGLGFSKNCRGEPYGDLIRQHNPSCFIETYQGGLSCCHHKNVLLDADQDQPQHEMTYQLKFRFWFQEYYGQKQMERFYYQTEAYSGEYDVPKCLNGTPPEDCIHSITAHFTGKDMIDNNLIKNSKGFNLIYLAPHCHAATCIDMELYNADTGDLICRVVGDMGKGSNKTYDEKGYIKLNPCLFGYDKGLLKPQLFRWDTNFTSIKRANNTYTHYGEMASWQMRGIII